MTKQTCQRRIQDAGPWEHGEGLDTWETDRWSRGKHVKWNWEWKPRTCSFCGSVHPEDALRLLDEGWELDATGKTYKVYLMPPGFRQSMETRLKNLREQGEPIGPSVWSPVPPVKLYTHHCDQQQVDKLNDSLQ